MVFLKLSRQNACWQPNNPCGILINLEGLPRNFEKPPKSTGKRRPWQPVVQHDAAGEALLVSQRVEVPDN